MGPALLSAQTHTLMHAHTSSQVQLLTAQGRFPRRGGGWRGAGAEGSRWSTNPLLLLGLIIFLHSSTNLPFLSLFLSP